MIYRYKNITTVPQTVLLPSKTQGSVSIRTFLPGSSADIDYPGLDKYVVSGALVRFVVDGPEDDVILSPVVAEVAPVEPIAEPIVESVVESVVEPTPEPEPEPTPEPVVEPVIEPTPEPIVEPIVTPAPVVAKTKKPTKSVKKEKK